MKLSLGTIVLALIVAGGPPSAQAQTSPQPIGAANQEFVHGSGIQIDKLTSVEIDNLVVLGRIWGFLKYHHPTVISGKRHWDFELFRIMPRVIDVRDRAARNKILFEWVKSLGRSLIPRPCAMRKDDRALEAPLSWLGDVDLLGPQLTQLLVAIRDRRPQITEQFYVKPSPAGNALFTNKSSYDALDKIDDGYRILSLFRFWNIVQYWSPYRELTRRDWDDVLPAFLPQVIAAGDAEAYRNVLFSLMHEVADSHTALWSDDYFTPPPGDCNLPLRLGFVGDQLVVLGFRIATVSSQTGLQVGDVISSVDGISIATLTKEYAPYQAGSNSVILLRSLAPRITRGRCSDVRLDILRGTETHGISIQRLGPDQMDNSPVDTNDRPGETLQWLEQDVAYLKLSSFSNDELPKQMGEIVNARGLIIDIRAFPHETAAYTLPSYFIDAATPFAVFTVPDVSTPGDFVWRPPFRT